jgi:hypothetical protein
MKIIISFFRCPSFVKQTLAGLKSAQASFETFALGTEKNRQNN